MGREIRLFKSEEPKSRSDTSSFIHQLGDKVSQGMVVLSKGQEEVTLNIPENVILEIQAEDEDKGSKGTQHSLKMEIKWFDDDTQGQGGSLELS